MSWEAMLLELGEAAVRELLEIFLSHPDPRRAVSVATRQARAEAEAAKELLERFGH